MSKDYIWTAERFLDEDFSQSWIVEPLFPRGGNVFLHGKRNIGKTALIMSVATSLVHGGYMFGEYHCEESKVALIESDMPSAMLHYRLWSGYKHYDYPGLLIYCPPYMNMLALDRDDLYESAYDTLQKHNPDVIVWDTLRKVQPLEENDNASPARVYGKARVMFPNACHVWVHHDKKTVPDQAMLHSEELFAGAGAWIDNADTGIHLIETGPGRCVLNFTKCRGGPPQHPIAVQLDPDTMMFYRYMPKGVELANYIMRRHPDWDEEDLAFWLATSMIYTPSCAQRFAAKYFEMRKDKDSDKYGQRRLLLDGGEDEGDA